MSDRDAYAVLQVAPDADHDTLMAAYRALARRSHPDLVGPSGTKRMVEANVAWDAVRTPARRAAYDRTRGLAAREPDAATRRPGPPQPARPTTSRAQATPPDPAIFWRQPAADGTGAAGPPPGRPSGSVLRFGRHIGWSIGEIARVDPGYLEWLEDRPEARLMLAEIQAALEQLAPAGQGKRPIPRRRFLARSG